MEKSCQISDKVSQARGIIFVEQSIDALSISLGEQTYLLLWMLSLVIASKACMKSIRISIDDKEPVNHDSLHIQMDVPLSPRELV